MSGALIVTYQHGMLACFTRNGTGQLEQRALIDTGEHERTHVEIAELADELSTRFEWLQLALSPMPLRKQQALPKSSAPMSSEASRRQQIIEAVRAQPNMTAGEIGDVIGTTAHKVQTEVTRMVQLKLVARLGSGGQKNLYRYAPYDGRPKQRAPARTRSGRAEMAARRAALVDYVREHPDQTVMSIAAAVWQPHPTAAQITDVRKNAGFLVRDGLLTRRNVSVHGIPSYAYRLVEPAEPG